MKKGVIWIVVAVASFWACSGIRYPYQIQKAAEANKAMVVSAHPVATEIGLEVLRNGGNAIDAAIAVQYALAVTYPVAGNIGGGGFMVIRLKDGTTACLDFREKAPKAATETMYQDENGVVNEDASKLGHLASGVPGVVDGMQKAHERFGKLPMKDLISPAIDVAKSGFRITQEQAEGLNESRNTFLKYNTSKPVFVRDAPWEPGDKLVQKDLAKTLERIREEGPDGFYKGKTARYIVREMKKGKGIITYDDLEDYQAAWRTPVQSKYKQYTIIGMPPPSSGGIALAQLLSIVEEYPLRRWGFHDPRTIHLMAEAERRVYADRSKHLGDSDYYPVPLHALLDKAYLRKRMESFDEETATPSFEVEAGSFMGESEQTTHFSIVDSEGNAVSVTTTINGGYGSYVVVGGAGFLLNNEMDDFSVKPGVPNMFGLIGARANKIEPGKRMLSSMTPTIVTEGNNLRMVLGTPGGSTIITSVFQTILNVLEFDMTMPEAVAAKRFHHQWLPDAITIESDAFAPSTRQALESKGHQLKEREAIGRVDGILVLPNGRLQGGADPRGDDHAKGF